MASCTVLVADNAAYLEQALNLIDRLTDEDFTRGGQRAYGSGIGSHLRHCLDHYTNFLDGLPGGRIDYDARARDLHLEQQRSYAQQVLQSLVTRLRALSGMEAAQPVQVKMDCGDAADPQTWWTGSTVGRELQFLLSHTVHHYALIAMILRLHEIPPPAGFGVAPSTLRYLAAQSCAR